jgi:nicotinate phosphoribosyltransferase
MKKIINSLLDQDLYKFTMQQAVLELFPQAVVKYRFMNRGKQRFNDEFLSELKNQVYNYLPQLSLSKDEYLWSKSNIPYFKPQFLEYLKNYRFKPEEISHLSLDAENNLELEISGTWHSSILWEVVLMALISEVYFDVVDTDWSYDGQEGLAYDKYKRLTRNGCSFADFGTRRRRSHKSQDIAIKIFVAAQKELGGNSFVGTSNVHLAMKYGVKPIGTTAHEWTMGNSVLEGLRNADYYALHNWVRVYNTELGDALTDTYGLKSFLRNFNRRLSMMYRGIRHDSGSPYLFTDKMVHHYKQLNIYPMSKLASFSDNLNVDKAIDIKKYCEEKIQCSFGIGTHFTNDFENSPALNMVIKLWKVNGIPVVKLGDDVGKEMGEPNAVAVAKWTHYGTPVITDPKNLYFGSDNDGTKIMETIAKGIDL